MPDISHRNQLIYTLVMNNGAEFDDDWREYTVGTFSTFGLAMDHAINNIRNNPEYKSCRSFKVLLFKLDGLEIIEAYECETHKRGDSFAISFYIQGNVHWHISGQEEQE